MVAPVLMSLARKTGLKRRLVKLHLHVISGAKGGAGRWLLMLHDARAFKRVFELGLAKCGHGISIAKTCKVRH